MKRGVLTRATAVCVAFLLAAFFAFVGFHKAFAPLPELAQHRVWTLALPELAGRMVGWSELVLAAMLLACVAARTCLWTAVAAVLLAGNQMIAAVVHWSRGEADAIPQNAILIALLAFVAVTVWIQHTRRGEFG